MQNSPAGERTVGAVYTHFRDSLPAWAQGVLFLLQDAKRQPAGNPLEFRTELRGTVRIDARFAEQVRSGAVCMVPFSVRQGLEQERAG